jgi:exoribonuclease R
MSHHGDLRAVARQAMLDRGLQPDFSEAAQREVCAITQAAVPSDGAVRDLRGLLWASVDNDDSLDIDQLSVAEPLAGGAVRVLVAVADVGAVVKTASAIDDHARTNTTSVYTATQVFPMLPEKLSTDLTSLGQEADRIALVMEMTVSAEGSVAGPDVYRTTVRNQAKLAYNGVAAWLDGTAPPPARVGDVAGMGE